MTTNAKRSFKRWSDLKKEVFTQEKLEQLRQRVDKELLEMDLRELRIMAGKTQKECEKESKIVQSEISKLERRDDHLVSTLRRYVQALGGDLELVVHFGDKSIRLKGI